LKLKKKFEKKNFVKKNFVKKKFRVTLALPVSADLLPLGPLQVLGRPEQTVELLERPYLLKDRSDAAAQPVDVREDDVLFGHENAAVPGRLGARRGRGESGGRARGSVLHGRD